MNYQSDKIIFDFASSADSPAILNLLEEEPSGGALSLVYTRRPDPVASFAADCDGELYIGRDTESGVITTINQMASQIIGIEESGAEGQHISDVLRSDDFSIEELLNSDEPIFEREVICQCSE